MAAPALIFDLDGTLVDSLADLRTAINRLLQELRLPPASLAEARVMLGDGAAAFVRRALESRGLVPEPAEQERFTHRYLEFYGAEPVGETQPYPGVPETLERLCWAGHDCAVCTNKPKRAAEAVLEALGLVRFFGAVVCPEDVGNRKPHPDHLAAAIAALGRVSSAAVMTGDSANDVRPARAASWSWHMATVSSPRNRSAPTSSCHGFPILRPCSPRRPGNEARARQSPACEPRSDRSA